MYRLVLLFYSCFVILLHWRSKIILCNIYIYIYRLLCSGRLQLEILKSFLENDCIFWHHNVLSIKTQVTGLLCCSQSWKDKFNANIPPHIIYQVLSSLLTSRALLLKFKIEPGLLQCSRVNIQLLNPQLFIDGKLEDQSLFNISMEQWK